MSQQYPVPDHKSLNLNWNTNFPEQWHQTWTLPMTLMTTQMVRSYTHTQKYFNKVNFRVVSALAGWRPAHALATLFLRALVKVRLSQGGPRTCTGSELQLAGLPCGDIWQIHCRIYDYEVWCELFNPHSWKKVISKYWYCNQLYSVHNVCLSLLA